MAASPGRDQTCRARDLPHHRRGSRGGERGLGRLLRCAPAPSSSSSPITGHAVAAAWIGYPLCKRVAVTIKPGQGYSGMTPQEANNPTTAPSTDWNACGADDPHRGGSCCPFGITASSCIGGDYDHEQAISRFVEHQRKVCLPSVLHARTCRKRYLDSVRQQLNAPIRREGGIEDHHGGSEHEDKISDRRQRVCGCVVPEEVCRQNDLLNVGRVGSPPY